MLPVSVLIRNRPKAYLLEVRMSVAEAASFLREHRIGGAPVVRNGKLVGFLSERDIVFSVVAERLDASATTVGEIMSKPVLTATIEETVEVCEQRMRKAHVRHLPILRAGKVVACISLRDLLQSELRHAEEEVRHLTDYVRGTTSG